MTLPQSLGGQGRLRTEPALRQDGPVRAGNGGQPGGVPGLDHRVEEQSILLRQRPAPIEALPLRHRGKPSNIEPVPVGEAALFHDLLPGLEGQGEGLEGSGQLFQSQKPAVMAQAVNMVVHKGATAKEAYEFFQDTK